MSAKVFFRRMTPKKIMEGVFAVHKPTGISSAQALRDLQSHFNPSELFTPLLAAEREVREKEKHNQRKRRKDKRMQVKIGHGGTLDPLATGVLIAGIGKGTKSLQDFLLCTKVYETVVLFGTSTDTYDRVGKVLSRAPYAHITKEMVEETLEQFRGKFMQLPPLFSALKMDGKPLYEYAREGKEIPRKIERRPVEVLKLELIEWMEGGTHLHVAPTDEAGHAEINVANKLWRQENVLPGSSRVKDSGSVPEPSLQAEALLEEKIAEEREEVAGQQKNGTLIPEGGKSESWEAGVVNNDANLAPDSEVPPKGTFLDGEKDVDKQEKEDVPASGHRIGDEKASKGAVVAGGVEQSPEAQSEKAVAEGRKEVAGGEQGDISKPESVGGNETTESLDKEGTTEAEAAALSSFERQKRKLSEDQDDLILERPPPKVRKGKAPPPSSADTAMMSGGLPSPSRDPSTTPIPTIETSSASISSSIANSGNKEKGPPAVRLRMTVTSGFYVRSLCHDLGAAVGSAALMAELERTRQGEFELGKNVLEWEDLAKGEKVWGPVVEGALDEWHSKHGR